MDSLDFFISFIYSRSCIRLSGKVQVLSRIQNNTVPNWSAKSIGIDFESRYRRVSSKRKGEILDLIGLSLTTKHPHACFFPYQKSTQEFQELKVVPEGTFKVPTTIAPKKRGKGSRRPRRDLEVWSMGIRQTLNCYMIPGWMAPIQNVDD
ncbi:hypothetical protein CRE_28302 [Caenorhabditis remanei]|uniref:Uncharacterized protein n=1 Tax=Caenorhabditis remanei TaxID=31234 RepID=E3LN84_CAERE|nr:hypothetical protein CRE_28302 [Caenorhabditis remanei]